MNSEVKQAIQALNTNGILLYPTDTIWGIGCDATNPIAVSKVYHLKQRTESKALVCLVSDLAMLKKYVEHIPESAIAYLEQTTKPTTIIYNNPQRFAKNLIAIDNTIAIRIVASGFAHELVKLFNKPIVSTSANISGKPSPKSFEEISQDILKGVDYVVNLHDEKSDVKPSTIIKIESDGSTTVIRD